MAVVGGHGGAEWWCYLPGHLHLFTRQIGVSGHVTERSRSESVPRNEPGLNGRFGPCPVGMKGNGGGADTGM